MCYFKPKKKSTASLNILLSNGRFPVSIDLARQLKLAGHNVYVVDPMHCHVCKFSNSVKKSYQVPAPHVDAVACGTRNFLTFVNTTAIAYGQKIARSLKILVLCNSSRVYKRQKITSRGREYRLDNTNARRVILSG